MGTVQVGAKATFSAKTGMGLDYSGVSASYAVGFYSTFDAEQIGFYATIGKSEVPAIGKGIGKSTKGAWGWGAKAVGQVGISIADPDEVFTGIETTSSIGIGFHGIEVDTPSESGRKDIGFDDLTYTYNFGPQFSLDTQTTVSFAVGLTPKGLAFYSPEGVTTITPQDVLDFVAKHAARISVKDAAMFTLKVNPITGTAMQLTPKATERIESALDSMVESVSDWFDSDDRPSPETPAATAEAYARSVQDEIDALNATYTAEAYARSVQDEIDALNAAYTSAGPQTNWSDAPNPNDNQDGSSRGTSPGANDPSPGNNTGDDETANSPGGGSPGNDGGSSYGNQDAGGTSFDNTDRGDRSFGPQPILLDLDGNGLKVTELSRSTIYVDAGGDGLLHRTAWADAGDGVLFYDPDGLGEIVEKRQYVFTEWDPTATSDVEAIASVFDSNSDGVLDASDTAFSDFKVMVTNADGSTTAKTLTELGITSIDLTADATHIELPDGSVITGQTTFTRSDGTTGTVGDTILAAEAQGHRVDQVETTDGSGNRVVTLTAYAADGRIEYEIHSVTSPDGSQITNRYDDNGDGVVDRIQTIDTVTQPDSSIVETEANSRGSDAATAVLTGSIVTTTSADGLVETIERDSSGGGWFDQREVRTTHANGSRTIVTSDLAEDGSVIRSVTETTTIDGLSRTEAVDEDGDGTADTTVAHTVTIHPDDSRTEIVSITNQDASLRSKVTEDVSADGRSKTILRDLDGDGDTDTREELAIVVGVGGDTTSTMTVKNGDGTVRSSVTTAQSADALTKTIQSDQDGDGDIDLTVVDATVINGDGSRENTVTQTNTDSSVRAMRKVTLGADKVSSETWEDLNQNGVFEATDLVRSVVVDGVTQERTATDWMRNADGSVRSKTISVTSADGLDRQTDFDVDGDGNADTTVIEATSVDGSGVATTTIETRNRDNSLRHDSTGTTSADGLTITVETDIDGDGQTDGKIVDASVENGDGSTTRTVSEYAGNGTTLLSRTVTSESADRRTITVSSDTDGDGNDDAVTLSVEATDGAHTLTRTSYNADGSVIGRTVTTTSANGLVSTAAHDFDGDLLADQTVATATVLNADGSRTTTRTTTNRDGSTRSEVVTTVSDDGLVVTIGTDADGDGTDERVSTATSVLNADGSVTETVDIRSADGTLLNRSQTDVSDDGLTVVRSSDADADGTYDLVEQTQTVLQTDGSTVTTTELRDAANVLRNSRTVTVTDDARSVTTAGDINGDGQTDMLTTRVIGDDGITETVTSYQNSDGSLQSRTREVISDDGLAVTTSFDRDGNGTYERVVEDTTVLNADGSTTRTIERKAENGSVYSRSETVTSDDGLTVTVKQDSDGDNRFDRTTIRQTSLAADGTETLTEQTQSRDESVIETFSRVTSADGRTVTVNRDADGNGFDDVQTTTVLANDGLTTSTSNFYSETGTLLSTVTRTQSSDGLESSWSFDRDGDGTVELQTTDITTLDADGGRTRTVIHKDGQGATVASETVVVSDDGLDVSTDIDLDGDGVNEFETDSQTVFAANGTTTATTTTRDAGGATLASVTETTSGDGLQTTRTTDYTGDGSSNRSMTLTEGAGGGWTQTDQQFGPASALQRAVTTIVSADERTHTTTIDLDGDGDVDRETISQLDLNEAETTTYEDKADNGSTEALITRVRSANGIDDNYAFDLDGDGTVDLTRQTEVSYDAVGNRITRFTETYGSEKLHFTRETTEAANRLSSLSTVDLNGDGITDGTTRTETTLHADGSSTTVTGNEYTDGTFRSSYTETVSADGRTAMRTHDYDGDESRDKTIKTVVQADGSRVVTETGYNADGSTGKTFVSTTSADGLLTTVSRDGIDQTLTRSAVDNGSYVWDNGVTASPTDTHIAVSHEVDAAGIETWRMDATTNGSTTTTELRLDAAAKARVLEEAARVYDSVLDRELDFTEVEVLVAHVSNGQLDVAGLAGALLASAEFATRFGTLDDAQFVSTVYLNTFGRAPSLEELDAGIDALKTGSLTRAALVQDLSQSIEHVVVGNGRKSSNNPDVFLIAPRFERSLDKAYVATLIVNLMDVVRDRPPTTAELASYSDRLLTGTERLDDLADELLDATGIVYGGEKSLFGLNGSAFVEQAFFNALNRSPTAQEAQVWQDNLSSGHITKGQLVAALAQSVDYASEERDYVLYSHAAASHNVQKGGDGNDSLYGGSGADVLFGNGGDDTLTGGGGNDVLVGGAGNDLLRGETGNDVYYFTRGDGHDTVEESTTATDLDTLSFGEGIDLDDIVLRRDGDDMYVYVRGVVDPTVALGSLPDLIRLTGWNNTASRVELLRFADGSTFDISQILVTHLGQDLAGNELAPEVEGLFDGYSSWANQQGSFLSTLNWMSGDYNGDGKTDMMKTWGSGGVMYADVHVSDGAGFILQNWASAQGGYQNNLNWMSGDYDGDGKTDMMKAWGGGGLLYADVHLSTGTAFVMQRWATQQGGYLEGLDWMSGDFDGDGKDDMMKVFKDAGQMIADVHLSTGTAFEMHRWATHQGGMWDSMVWMSGDYDGDGKSDIMKLWDDGGQMTADVHLSTGSGFTMQRWATQQGAIWDSMQWMSGDYNGDGKTDIMKLWEGNGQMHADVHLSTGSGFVMQRWATEQGGIWDGMTWMSGDYNGDARVDIMKVFDNAGLVNADVHTSAERTGINGSFTNDWINGFAGDDVLYGMEGDDLIFGDSGNDQILGEVGNDTLSGGEGDDDLDGGYGDDTLYGGAGADTLDGSLGSDELHGGTGDDLVQGGDGDDTLYGNDGADTLKGGSGNDTSYGGTGNDRFEDEAGDNTHYGGLGDDAVVYGGARASYTHDLQADGTVVIGRPGAGTDTLHEIERANFTDGELLFDIDSANVGFVYRMFGATFDRHADEEGLRFWTGVLDDFDANNPAKDKHDFLADEFLASDEYVDLYGTNPTNEAFVTTLYNNALGRAPDLGGFDFWVNALEQGAGRDYVLVTFAQTPESVTYFAPDIDEGIWIA